MPGTGKSKTKSKGKPSKNTGKEYEILLEKVIQGLNSLEGEGLQNVRIVRDIDLEEKTPDQDGKPMKRQIDLLWEFKLGGMLHQILFQAKNLKDKVERHHIDTFKTVLNDIPGNPKGAIVTKVGFDSGVLNYARHHGIGLYLLRTVEPSDFDGVGIPAVDLQLNLYRKQVLKNRLFALHETQDLEEYLTECKKKPGDLRFYDNDGVFLCTGEDLELEIRAPLNAGEGVHRPSVRIPVKTAIAS